MSENTKTPHITFKHSKPLFLNLANFPYNNENPLLLKILHCGKEAYDNLYFSERYDGRSFVFIYTVDGEIELTTNFVNLKLKKGDLAFISFKEYSKLSLENGFWSNYFLACYGNSAEDLYKKLKLNNKTIIHNFDPTYFINFIEKILKNTSTIEHDNIDISVNLYHLICDIDKSKDASIKNNKLNATFNYIFTNLNKCITIDNLSEISGFSKFYLCRMFKEETGKGIMEYINNLKIEKAKKLLIETTKTNDEIAEECGFGDVRNFYYLFKQILKMSPYTYRKNNWIPF